MKKSHDAEDSDTEVARMAAVLGGAAGPGDYYSDSDSDVLNLSSGTDKKARGASRARTGAAAGGPGFGSPVTQSFNSAQSFSRQTEEAAAAAETGGAGSSGGGVGTGTGGGGVSMASLSGRGGRGGAGAGGSQSGVVGWLREHASTLLLVLGAVCVAAILLAALYSSAGAKHGGPAPGEQVSPSVIDTPAALLAASSTAAATPADPHSAASSSAAGRLGAKLAPAGASAAAPASSSPSASREVHIPVHALLDHGSAEAGPGSPAPGVAAPVLSPDERGSRQVAGTAHIALAYPKGLSEEEVERREEVRRQHDVRARQELAQLQEETHYMLERNHALRSSINALKHTLKTTELIPARIAHIPSAALKGDFVEGPEAAAEAAADAEEHAEPAHHEEADGAPVAGPPLRPSPDGAEMVVVTPGAKPVHEGMAPAMILPEMPPSAMTPLDPEAPAPPEPTHA